MKLQSNDSSSWFDDIKDTEPEYKPIKCWSVTQFFKLKGKSAIISKSNMECITDLKYVIQGKDENKYYLREFTGNSFEVMIGNIDKLYLCNNLDPDVFGYDNFIHELRKLVAYKRVWILYTPQMVDDMRVMLHRLWRNNRKDEGSLAYTDYVDLVELMLTREEYQDTAKAHTGYKTALNIMDNKIIDIWKDAKSSSSPATIKQSSNIKSS